MAEAAKTETSFFKKRAPTLYAIIAFKLTKGILFLLLAFGFYKLAGRDLQEIFDTVLRWVHLDPEKRFLSNIGDRLDRLTPANVRWFATGTLLYSLFSLVEGVGLIFRAPWAGWLAIGESAFFIPIEIYELARHPKVAVVYNTHPAWWNHPKFGLLLVLVVNIFIVWYLFQNRHRLFRHHQH
jgi:uncharacterized membrane protein (DUF2068 family)